MTPDQFAAIATLLNSRGGPAEVAARLVLVDGIAPKAASEIAGCSQQSVTNATRRYRDTAALARIAAGL